MRKALPFLEAARAMLSGVTGFNLLQAQTTSDAAAQALAGQESIARTFADDAQ